MSTGKCPSLQPLAVLLLGLLAERPMHPYEMFQTTIERREDRLAKFRAGTVYHAVDRLADQGLIAVHDVQREGNRPARTVYEITDAGRIALDDNLREIIARHPVEYPELYLALAEAHGLPRDRVIQLLSERLDAMRGEMKELEESSGRLRTLGHPEMFALDLGCRMATLGTQIDWLDDLVGRLTRFDIEWLDDPGSPYRSQTSTEKGH